MAQQLNQVPPNLQVWEVQGTTFLVRMVPDVDPPIPLVWRVTSADEREALGITRVDRRFSSWDDFYSTGPLDHGTTRELLNTTEDPWEIIQSNYETEVRVKPWLADPEILSLWLGAALEGRSLTEAELQGTEWWRTHTSAERSWLALNAQDPAQAQRIVADNRARVTDLFSAAGVDNASEELINTVADQWTTGSWSEIYATNQIRMLADPNLEGDLDPVLTSFRDGLDGTRQGEDDVRNMITRWLGPVQANTWSEDNISTWATRFREDPDARLELEEVLRRHRLALFPEYDNANLTYEDIAQPWRGVWSQEWGGVADESDPLFARIVRLNDVTEAKRLLRKEGLQRNNPTVSQRVLSDVGNTLGQQVRQAHPAIL